MPLDVRDAARVWDMLTFARDAVRMVAGVPREEYLSDLKHKLAAERLIEVIGEAARGVSRAGRDAHPEIPWQGIMNQRHVIAHEYGRIDHELIWVVLSKRIPELIPQLERLLADSPPPTLPK